MAPLTRASGSHAGFTSFNSVQNSAANEPDIIEIEDDDDDESMEDEEIADEYDEEQEDGDDDEEMDDDDDEEPEESEEESISDANGINGNESPLALGNGTNGYNDHDATNTPDLFTSAGAQEALHPLRRTADRVTRQIEAFAEKLDRFKQKGSYCDDFGSYQAAYQLVKDYQTLAEDAIQDISKQSTLKRAKMGWSANRSNGTPTHDPKAEEEKQRLQLEANTWQLLLNLISVNDPPSKESARQAQATVFQSLHRYSSDRDVWEGFLSADHYALECMIIMKWLEHTARNGAQDIDSVISELEAQAERGQGLWTHGWLYTKETIKGQKRLRAWPQPLEPNDPGLTATLMSSDKSEPLVTQLDPDAVTRQKHNLQKQDQFYDRATWMACWKMLRQGESWTKIREWSEARLENWRAVSLCGSSVDPKSGGQRTPLDDGATRLMNWRSQDSWRAACSALARNQKTEDFERAVYGLLCGESEAAFKICQSWDDYLYVYFNGVLLSRYQSFCKQLQRKISHTPLTPASFVPDPVGYADVNKFVQYTKGNDRVGVEARNPYRTIQAAILGKSYDTFFYSLAKAVSQVAAAKAEHSTFVPDLSPTQVDDSLVFAAEDGDALRIAAHLYVIVASIGSVRSDTQFFDTASVNVIGYIANLEEAGILDTIPLYASLLPTHMAHSVLGQVLIEIVEPRERKQMVRLMDKHGIEVEAVLQDQWRWISASVSTVDHSRTLKQYPKVTRRKDGHHELVNIKSDYIGTDLSVVDERIIRSLEWLRYVDGQWGRICQLGALLYRKFYVTGKLSAARELSRRMRLSDISQESFGFDLTEFSAGVEDGAGSATPEPSSPSKSRLLGSHRRSRSIPSGVPTPSQTNILIQQSSTMRDLEEMILGFDALERFAIAYEKIDKNKRRRDSGTIKNLRLELQEALDDIAVHVDAVLDEWLVVAEDEGEQAELEKIRNVYIPELFLDYHNALYFAGHVLNSEILVQCMNLAIQVSESDHLTRSFMASRRMVELTHALALSSKAMVNTRAQPGERFLGGESLGIWNTAVNPDENEMLRQMR
ncbi:Nucleoporin nup84 [Aspergillus nanangensis]|uniref:Nuclear pore complex protein n=1 Tax=Aspergillus nanangensis TaxID=2582783 RepID=A0AAD4CR87_ASPNN|nr:Nucleoporin nup84 [Aspergillus nanangensis]